MAASNVAKPAAGAGDFRGWLDNLDAEASQRIRRMLLDLTASANEIREMNRVQTRLIQGTRRTLHVLGNALASLAPTYSMPAPLDHSADSRMQP